jgi:hypothetical protein
MARRHLSPFEDVLKASRARPTQIYETSLPLQPGTYLLDIAAKDLGSKYSGMYQTMLEVPGGA